MNTVVTIIWFSVYAFVWFFFSRYDVQMFQQNSYKADRYWRWFKGSDKFAKNRGSCLIALGLSLVNTACLILAAAMLLLLGLSECRTEYKVRIVYTKRVIRLFATMAVIDVALICPALHFWDFESAAALSCLLLFLSKGIVLLADFINKPIEKAISKWYYNDAKRILTERPDLVIIGVTGSFGKTSTKNYLYRILSEKYNTLVTPGNFNTTLGVVRTVREQLKPYHQVFIVEMGAKQPGDIEEICNLVHPSIGIVTAVGEMHLETFGTLANIQKTKFELVRAIPPDGMGVINVDSAGIASYADIPFHCEIVRYGIDSANASFRASGVSYSPSGTGFEAGGEHFATHLLGAGNILDILASLAVADRLGVPKDRQKIAVSKLQSVEHRLSSIRKGGMTILDDAYNSNPEGAAMALDVLGKFAVPEGSKRIVITPGFIEMGEKQVEANREFGRRIAAVADIAIVVNKSNREAILAGLEDVNFSKEKTVVVDSLSEAVAHLSSVTVAGDVVLYENDLPDMFK